jgi:hypothetical protein
MRLAYFLLLWSASAATAFAQTSSDPIDACAGVKDDSARLACFDRQTALKHAAPAGAPQAVAAQPQAGGAPRPSAAAPTAQPAPPQPSVTEPNAGFANIDTPNTRPRPAPITATITQFVPMPGGDVAFRLDNGQLWQQTDSRSYLNAHVNDHITITKSALGAFFLTTSDRLHIRVKRIQ